MTADHLQTIEALFTNVRSLTSDNNYQAVASVFDEIPSLKKQINSKDGELQDLRNEIASLKARYESRIEDELELYRTKHNKLEGEKAKLSKEISSLQTKIQQKDKSVGELNDTQRKLQGQFEQVNKSLQQENEKVIAANKAITGLQKSLKSKDTEIDDLKDRLRNERTQVSNVESQLLALEKENTSLLQKLESSTTRLSEVEGFGTKLRPLDDSIWTSQWDKIWEYARQTVEAHFNQDLPENNLEELARDLRASEFMDRSIPLPQSNSPAAKRMRIAAILLILARSIDQFIFQPTYILDNDEDEEIRLLSVRLALMNSKKEAFFRALLLSIDPHEQTKIASKRVDRVVREVAWTVRNLLPAAQYESFRSGLEQVVNQACDFWQIVQRAPEKFEPYFQPNHYEEVQWQPLKFEGGEQSAAKAPAGDKELLVIFPRVYILEDEEPDPITNGVALMKSQTTAAAEEEELERRKPSSPTRPRSNKTRNKSFSLNGGSDFLSQTAQSGAH